MRSTYRAIASREDSWWIVRIPGLDRITQSRRLDGVEATARDLISLWLDVPADSFDVEVEVNLGSELGARVERVKSLRAEADRVQAEASASVRALARSLAEHGWTVRDVARVLGVSFQRVQQLIEGANSRASDVSPATARAPKPPATNRRVAAKATTRTSTSKTRTAATARAGTATAKARAKKS